MQSILSDDQLMCAVASGNQDAFSELCERWRDKLTRMAFRMLRDYQRAEDVAQETFLRIYRSAESFVGYGFDTWAYRIARNAVVDQARRGTNDYVRRAIASRRNEDDDTGVERLGSSDTDRLSSAECSEMESWIEAAAEGLPDDQRTVFYLSTTAGMTLVEIAVAMEANLPTTKSRLRLAKEKIRNQLAACKVGDPRMAACV